MKSAGVKKQKTELGIPDSVFFHYQKKWIEDNAQIKVIEKSRRTGITWAESADNVLIAASNKDSGGQNVYYIGYNEDITREYIDACAFWAKHFNDAAAEITQGIWENDSEKDKAIKTFTISFPSGFKIVALTSSPRSLRGRQGVVVIDEAAFHDNLNALIDAAMALLIWGGKVRIISTHNGIDNFFNEFINDIRAGKRSGSVHRIDFKEAVAQGLYARTILRSGKPFSEQEQARWMASIYHSYGSGAAEELDCVPRNGNGAWLSRALIESRMSQESKVLRWSCPEGFELLSDAVRSAECRDWMASVLMPEIAKIDRDCTTFCGSDFGRSGDLSVHVPMVQQKNLVRRVPFILELRNVPFRQQEQITFCLLDHLPKFTGGAFDARGNGQYLAEYAVQRYGSSRISPVMLSEGWYREHMPPLKAAFEDGNLIDLPADEDTLNDLRSIELVRGVPRVPDARSAGADGGKRHGDTAVAMVLAYFATRQLNAGPVRAASRRRTQLANWHGY